MGINFGVVQDFQNAGVRKVYKRNQLKSHNKTFAVEHKKPRPLKSDVHGGCARTRNLTEYRKLFNQATLARKVHGIGQNRDSPKKSMEFIKSIIIRD